jgi:hypothetical protein
MNPPERCGAYANTGRRRAPGRRGPTPCPSRARARQKPETLTGCQAPVKPQLTREAAVGYRARDDLLSGRSRVRVAFGAQVIYQPRRPTDEPPGKGGAFAPIRRDDEHQGDEHLENGPRGGSRPVPPLYGSGRPAFSPPTVLRGRGRIFPAPARGEPRTPVNQSVNEMRRARLRRER